jgi:hypothetical protein
LFPHPKRNDNVGNYLTRGVGRPKVNVSPEQVGKLRGQGVSWRKIAKALKIGTATAMRLSELPDSIIDKDIGVHIPKPKRLGEAQAAHD